MTEFAIRPPDLLTPYCTPGNAPFKKGETVIFPDGKTGVITRAYGFDNKYAVKLLGSGYEHRGPDSGFVYYRKEDLHRPTPLATEESLTEPQAKIAKVGEDTSVNVDTGPRRFAGIVKWYQKEKGFGKIEAISMDKKGAGEEVFVHKKQMDGGPDGAHAQGIDVGVGVTYELTTGPDGKPAAANVQVRGIAPTKPLLDASLRDPADDAFIVRLLQGMHVSTHQITGAYKTSSEDRFFARVGTPINLGDACKNAHCALFGVFDGHSGASCSEFIHVQLEKQIFNCIRERQMRDQGGKEVTSDQMIKAALLAAFRNTEHNYFQYINKLEGGAASAWATAGSTSCTVTFYGPDEMGQLRMVVANAGDSRAVLGKRDGRAVRLSEDHTPDVAGERKRIEQQGASVVNASGIWRIVMPSKRGTGLAGLSVSRGFGDLEYKQPAGVVSAVPDVFVRTVDPREDSFVIVGSDGIWGPVQDQEAVRIVVEEMRKGGHDAVQNAAKRLAETAHQLEDHDDKTVVLCFFGEMPDPNASSSAVPVRSGVVKMKPRAIQAQLAASQVAMKSGGDDIFGGSKPAAASDDLDDLFSSYAQEMGR